MGQTKINVQNAIQQTLIEWMIYQIQTHVLAKFIIMMMKLMNFASPAIILGFFFKLTI